MSHMIGLPVIPFLNMMTHPVNYAISLFILTTIVLILGKDIIKNGYKNLIHKTPNMDTLVMIGVLASYIYSIYGTIQILKGHAMHVESLYFESAAIVIFFIEIGRYIENKNKDKKDTAIIISILVVVGTLIGLAFQYDLFHLSSLFKFIGIQL